MIRKTTILLGATIISPAAQIKLVQLDKPLPTQLLQMTGHVSLHIQGKEPEEDNYLEVTENEVDEQAEITQDGNNEDEEETNDDDEKFEVGPGSIQQNKSSYYADEPHVMA